MIKTNDIKSMTTKSSIKSLLKTNERGSNDKETI